MADRVSATIRIGGTLAHVNVPDLIAVIEREGISTDWEGTRFSQRTSNAANPFFSWHTRWRGECSRNSNRSAAIMDWPMSAGPEDVPEASDRNGSLSMA